MKKLLMVVWMLLLACLCTAAQAEECPARAYLGESFEWQYAQEVAPRLHEMVPVYAAPSENAWRGAGGKAAVSLTEPLTVLGRVPDSDWLLIEYEISAKERRIGYIDSQDDWTSWVTTLSLAGIVGKLAGDTVLTDDPRASGRAMATLPEGSCVSVLGCVGEELYYVETTIDGKTACGFVPACAVVLPGMTPLNDVMARMEGAWGFSGGAEVLGYGVIVTTEGSLLICDTDDSIEMPPTCLIPDHERTFTYAVYPTDAEDRRFWSEYVITLEAEGSHQIYGLSFFPGEEGETERMHIEEGPSGGFYTRYETMPEIVDDN